MICWEAEFCELLVQKGFYVIRFDNRDIGLSTKFEEAGVPDIMAAMEGKPVEAPYTLEDMADDAVGLLDALDIESAHVCGASVGGDDCTGDFVPASGTRFEFGIHYVEHREP